MKTESKFLLIKVWTEADRNKQHFLPREDIQDGVIVWNEDFDKILAIDLHTNKPYLPGTITVTDRESLREVYKFLTGGNLPAEWTKR